MDKRRTISLSIFLFVSGGLVALLSFFLDTAGQARASVEFLRAFGFATMGYAPIMLAIFAYDLVKAWGSGKLIATVSKYRIRELENPTSLDLPALISSNVEGCITPAGRSDVDLKLFWKLRAYHERVIDKNTPDLYPPIVLCTGRSQGYVELLAQELGMINENRDIPMIIENGCALYYPASRRTVPLILNPDINTMDRVREVLDASAEFDDNEFEPKKWMVTVNPSRDASGNIEAIGDIKSKAIRVLTAAGEDTSKLRFDSCTSALDITPADVTKVKALLKILGDHFPDSKKTLKDVVAIVDSTSDLPLLGKIKTAYCSTEKVHPEVRSRVERLYGADHAVAKPDILAVLEVLRCVCRVSIT